MLGVRQIKYLSPSLIPLPESDVKPEGVGTVAANDQKDI
jgi:hypothetical protein